MNKINELKEYIDNSKLEINKKKKKKYIYIHSIE